MVQIEDDIYTKLKKDADDNKQIIRIIRIAILFLMFVILYFTVGIDFIKLGIQQQAYQVEYQHALDSAKTNVDVLNIERDNMSMDDYIKWLNARNLKTRV